MKRHLARRPSTAPAERPSDERYYDPRDLESELRRTFQICHECRMCVGYCGSFPELFARIDRDVDANTAYGAEALTDEDFRVVSEECWQCKICYIKCPYTKDEDASELLNFPRLMLREKANHAKRHGVALVDRVLGEPELIGQLGSGRMAPAGQLIQANRLLRKVQEKLTGISAAFELPPLATQTAANWWKTHQSPVGAGDAGEVALFATCYGNYNTPEVVRSAVAVLEHAGYRISLVSDGCCGMPNLDGGDVSRAREKIERGVASLYPLVERGMKVLVPSATCAYTMKKEWPDYVETAACAAVAEATMDLMEFVEQRRRAKALPTDFVESLGKVAYHAACHLRAQKIGFPAARVLGKMVPDTEVRIIQECSAVDGTWGMKAAHFETGRRYAKKLSDEVQAQEDDLVVTDCSLSVLRIRQETGREAMHPVQALARAYGLEE